MIIFDLICTDAAHQFEGWFGSSNDYEKQKSDGLLICPICGSAKITKAMMAPNVGVKGNRTNGDAPLDKIVSPTQNNDHPSQSPEVSAVAVSAEHKELVGKLAKAQAEILKKSEWVGDSFPEKARAIHYGDSEEKLIHGTATPEDVTDLEEEGIELSPLPFPVAPPESQN